MKVRNAGKYGVVQDLKPWELPPEAWSRGNNVRPVEGAMEKIMGVSSSGLGTPIEKPMYLLAYRNAGTFFWIYASTGKISVTDGMTHKDITRTSGGDYSATLTTQWTGQVFGGIPILNNQSDDPQQWSGDFGTPTKFEALSNWPANTKCKALRGFKQFLIAMNVSKGATDYPRMVKWSTAASANAVPSSWDETDAANDAGEFEFYQSSRRLSRHRCGFEKGA